MRKYYSIIIIALMLSLLCSCSTAGFSSALGSPSANPSDDSSSTDLTAEPSPSQAVLVDNTARAEIFRTFLSDNYQELSDAFFEGISGIGFIDLDLDGGIEMLLFDAGASAAMGLQFFDIIDDKVECVSANMESVGAAFGGEHMSDVVVNANYFKDFRLFEDKETGKKFFIVNSGNGAADFSYSELIRFGNCNGVLTLESLMYKYEEYDIDTGNVKSDNYKIAGEDADNTLYEAAYKSFFTGAEDLGYVAMGAFLWENDGYSSGLNGLLKMADRARFLFYANSFYIA